MYRYFFPLVSLIIMGAGVAAESPKSALPSAEWSGAEKFVWSELAEGRVANLDDNKCPDSHAASTEDNDANWLAECRTISADFVEDLVTKAPWQQALPNQGVQIEGAHIIGDLTLDNAKLTHRLAINNSRIEGDIDLNYLRTDDLVGVINTFVIGQLRAIGLRGNSDILLHGSRIKGDCILDYAKIDGVIDMSGANVEGNFSGGWLQAGNLFLRSAAINGTTKKSSFHDVSLRHARINQDLDMRGASLAGIMDGEGVQARNLLLGPVTVQDVKLSNAKVDGSVLMDVTSIAGKLEANNAKVDGAVLMDGTSIAGKLEADQLQAGLLLMRSTPTKTAIFSDIELRAAKIVGNFEMEGAEVGGRLDAGQLNVGGSLSLRNATFRGPIELALMHAANLDLRSSTFADVDLSGSTVVADLLLGRRSKDFGGKNQPMSWTSDCNRPKSANLWTPTRPELGEESTIRGSSLPGLNLRNAQFGSMQDDLEAWPGAGCLHLDGISFSRLGGFARPEVSSLERDAKRDASWWDLHWARLDSEFSSSPYTQLANAFTAVSKREEANDIRFLYRVRQRQAATGLGRWLDIALEYVAGEYVAGFGIGTYTFRVAYWIGGFTVVGAGLLWFTVQSARAHGPIWCFGASLSRLLPIIEINKEFTDFFDDPNRLRLNSWQFVVFSVLGLVGWILGGILAAAAVGLIQS